MFPSFPWFNNKKTWPQSQSVVSCIGSVKFLSFNMMIYEFIPLNSNHCRFLYLSLSSTSRTRVALWCRSTSRACSMVQENWGRAGRESSACWELRALALAWVVSVWICWIWSGSRAPLTCWKVMRRELSCLWSSFIHWTGSAHRFRSPFSNRKSSSW